MWGTGVEAVPTTYIPVPSIFAVEGIPMPGVHLSERTEHIEVSGTGTDFVPNLIRSVS